MYYYPQLAALFFVLSRVFWEKKAIYFLSVRAIKKRARKSRRFSKLFFRLTSEMRRVAIDLWRLDSLFRVEKTFCLLFANPDRYNFLLKLGLNLLKCSFLILWSICPLLPQSFLTQNRWTVCDRFQRTGLGLLFFVGHMGMRVIKPLV